LIRAALLLLPVHGAAGRAADVLCGDARACTAQYASNHPLTASRDVGAWGPGSFENDDALDLLDDVVDGGGMDVIQSAFMIADDGEYLEAPEASAAVAAAEIVAALAGRPAADLPGEAAEWVRAHAAAPRPALVRQARAAVQRVRTDSELKELWEEGEEAPTGWYACMDDLLRRLGPDAAGDFPA
jgi:hypothetical protein